MSAGDLGKRNLPQPWVMLTLLGVGRSGTSAITCGLQALGADLGNNLRRGSGKNPTGFFEDKDFLRISRRLKRTLGIRADSVRLIEEAEYDLPEVKAIEDDCVEMILRRFGRTPLWAYKYARTSRFFPFFQRVYERCGVEPRYVFALRNPLSLARSRARLEPERGSQEQSDLEWLVNVVPYFRRIRGQVCVFIDYDRLLAEPAAELERLGRGLGLAMTPDVHAAIARYQSDYLKPGIRHSRFTIEDLDASREINPLVRQAHRWLWKLSTDQIRFDDEELWQEWQSIEQRLEDLRPILRFCEWKSIRLRKAQASPLGPLQAVPAYWYKWRAS